MNKLETLIKLREQQQRKALEGDKDALEMVIVLSVMIHELMERRELSLMGGVGK